VALDKHGLTFTFILKAWKNSLKSLSGFKQKDTAVKIKSFMKILLLAGVPALLAYPLISGAQQKSYEGDNAVTKTASSVYDFEVKRIDGTMQKISDYAGRVLLIVNTASKCGLTPQYAGLQSIYEKYNAQGFEILAFPANNFLWQEPSTDKEIQSFCSGKYHVSFPLFSKISVKGGDQHPLYKYLTAESEVKGPVKWNFQKYLVDRKGNLLAVFHPKVEPDDARLLSIVEKALAQSPDDSARSKAERIGF